MCSQHLRVLVPPEPEDAIEQIGPAGIDASPYGLLFELAVSMVYDHLGHGTFVTINDDDVSVSPSNSPEAFVTDVRDLSRGMGCQFSIIDAAVPYQIPVPGTPDRCSGTDAVLA